MLLPLELCVLDEDVAVFAPVLWGRLPVLGHVGRVCERSLVVSGIAVLALSERMTLDSDLLFVLDISKLLVW